MSIFLYNYNMIKHQGIITDNKTVLFKFSVYYVFLGEKKTLFSDTVLCSVCLGHALFRFKSEHPLSLCFTGIVGEYSGANLRGPTAELGGCFVSVDLGCGCSPAVVIPSLVLSGGCAAVVLSSYSRAPITRACCACQGSPLSGDCPFIINVYIVW